jgi:hypothetical protein
MKRLRDWFTRWREVHAPVLTECVGCLGWFTDGYILNVAAHADDPTGPTYPKCLWCVGLMRRDQRGKMRPSQVGRRGNW